MVNFPGAHSFLKKINGHHTIFQKANTLRRDMENKICYSHLKFIKNPQKI